MLNSVRQYLVDGNVAALPPPGALRVLASTKEALEICAELAMVHALAFDRLRLDETVAVCRELASDDAHSRCCVALTEAWMQLSRGAGPEVAESLIAVEHAALHARQARWVLRAASLTALVQANASAGVDLAVGTARRASRMARTEGYPQEEYLASLALARVRRLAGHPYLATRILTALRRYASPPWRPWIDWELIMAGGLAAAGVVGETAPAHHLRTALEQLQRGRVNEWDASLDKTTIRAWSPARVDVVRLRAAVDAAAPLSPGEVAGWCRGESSLPPHGLLGVQGGGEIGDAAFVVTGAPIPPRRILRLGSGLAEVRFGEVRWLDPIRRRQARVDRLVAVLAMQGDEAMSVERAFREVWGFNYVAELHREALSVTIHRARERLSGAGALVAEGGGLRLVPSGVLLVPDPRCTPATDERVLQYVAGHAQVSAKETAGALGISLRAVQAALAELVEGGSCVRAKVGRHVAYAVEDTTFREPTAF